MIKLFITFCLTCFFSFSLMVQASIITPQDQSELKLNEDYIQYSYDGIMYDITWASNVNTQRWYIDTTYQYNTLFTPDFYDTSGWGYAGVNNTPELLTIFSGLSGLEIKSLFTIDNSYVNSFTHWNSIFNDVNNSNDISNINIKSTLSWFVPDPDIDLTSMAEKKSQSKDITSTSGVTYDTFYIRVQNNDIKSVPEPSTFIIFTLGLIAIARKKLFS